MAGWLVGQAPKRTKIGPQSQALTIYTGYFWLFTVQGRSDVIWCISEFVDFQQPWFLKTPGLVAEFA